LPAQCPHRFAIIAALAHVRSLIPIVARAPSIGAWPSHTNDSRHQGNRISK